MVDRKKALLAQIEAENKVSVQKKEACQAAIEAAKSELGKINTKTEKSEDLKKTEATREEYFKIRSDLQVTNAQIERERIKIEKQLSLWTQKKQAAQRDKDDLETRLDGLTDLKQFKGNLKECDKQMSAKQALLADLKKRHSEAKSGNADTVGQMQSLEKLLLEKEFELQEVENEKNVRT